MFDWIETPDSYGRGFGDTDVRARDDDAGDRAASSPGTAHVTDAAQRSGSDATQCRCGCERCVRECHGANVAVYSRGGQVA